MYLCICLYLGVYILWYDPSDSKVGDVSDYLVKQTPKMPEKVGGCSSEGRNRGLSDTHLYEGIIILGLCKKSYGAVLSLLSFGFEKTTARVSFREPCLTPETKSTRGNNQQCIHMYIFCLYATFKLDSVINKYQFNN